MTNDNYNRRVLAVDLDGSLVMTDTLWESVLAVRQTNRYSLDSTGAKSGGASGTLKISANQIALQI
jgi:hypothetical protein